MRVVNLRAEPRRRIPWFPPRHAQRSAVTDLATLLAPTLDDTYTLILDPHLPGVDPDLAALLVGPGGIRALLVRHWRGRFRHRGRAWEYDAAGSEGWVPCRTDPTGEATRTREQVSSWMWLTIGTQFPVEAAVAFPGRRCRVELEDPVTEVVTPSNAPWWAQRLGRVKRLDDRRAGRIIDAVLAAA